MARDTRKILEETAIRLFTERSIGEVSMRDIANEMGRETGSTIQTSTLYRHLESKEELVSRIFASAYSEIAGRLEGALPGSPTLSGKLLIVVQKSCEAYDQSPELIRFMLVRQHDAFARMERLPVSPLDIIAQICAEHSGEISMEPAEAAAIVTGILLQPMIHLHYGRLAGTARERIAQTHRACLRAITPEEN